MLAIANNNNNIIVTIQLLEFLSLPPFLSFSLSLSPSLSLFPPPSLSVSDRSGDAIAAYEKALSLDPRHTTAMTSLARVYRSIGENKKAEELFKRLLTKMLKLMSIN